MSGQGVGHLERWGQPRREQGEQDGSHALLGLLRAGVHAVDGAGEVNHRVVAAGSDPTAEGNGEGCPGVYGANMEMGVGGPP